MPYSPFIRSPNQPDYSRSRLGLTDPISELALFAPCSVFGSTKPPTFKIVSAESNKILSVEVYALEEGRQTRKAGWAVGIIILLVVVFYITQETELIPGTHIYRPDLEVSADYDEDVIQLLDPCDGDVTVSNIGGETATSVNLSLNYDGFGFGGTLNWFIGTLAPGESESRHFVLPSGVGKGDHFFTVTATSNEGSTDTERFVVHVAGVI